MGVQMQVCWEPTNSMMPAAGQLLWHETLMPRFLPTGSALAEASQRWRPGEMMQGWQPVAPGGSPIVCAQGLTSAG